MDELEQQKLDAMIWETVSRGADHMRRQHAFYQKGAGSLTTPEVVRYETPSYNNRDGSGNRTAGSGSGITMLTSGASPMWGLVGSNAPGESYFLDGDYNNLGGYTNNTISVVDEWFEFDFTTLRLITEMKIYFSGTMNCGTFQTQGWTGSVWVNIGDTFVMGAAATQTIDLSMNETGYTKYRWLGISGTSSWNAYWQEIEFEIAEISNPNLIKWRAWQTPLVLITHDLDQAESHTIYSKSFAYLQPRNIKATAYVQTNLMETGSIPSNAQLQEMNAAGWDIGNHSITHPLFTALTQAQIEAELSGAQAALEAIGLTRASKHVAYPSGQYDADTWAAMTATGMLTGRTVSPSTQSYPTNLYEIGYLLWLENSTPITLAAAKAAIDTAKAGNYVFFLLLHHFTEWAEADFQALVDYIIAQHVQPITIDELYRLNTGNITVTRPVGW
jgi:peptidoglycan/xylan/chitin deacetylase (PgdA/CDA1 family)